MTKESCKGIWVFAEQQDGALSPAVLELLAMACELKKHSGEEITAVLLGSGVSSLSETLIAGGADSVLLCEHANLAAYRARPYQQALTALAGKYRPAVILYPASALGCDLAPRMMVSLKTGLTADAIELGYDEDGDFYQVTPGYGGKIFARIVIPEKRPQMATVRAGVFSPAAPDPSRTGTVIREELAVAEEACYEVLSTEEKQLQEKSLEEANLVVSAGRGVKNAGDLAMLEELAGLLGGQLAGSRPVIDSGLLPHSVQIGQSGKTVKPEMMINVAVSGSVQYKVGMQNSACIVSVNKAPSAPIFDISHYGVVEDYRGFIPAVIEEIKRRRA